VSVEERDKAAGEILAGEQRLKVLKKALAAYVTKEGSFVLNGQAFSQTETATVTYPAALALTTLNLGGADTSGITLSKTAVAKPAKALDAEHLADLAKLAITKTGWRFGHKKAGADLDDDDEG
jgi:hypothetical protein